MKKLCRTTKGSSGKVFDIPNTHPLKDNCVILCRNNGGGWKPFKFLLEHQVYLEDIKEDMKEHGGAHVEYAVFRVNPEHYHMLVEF